MLINLTPHTINLNVGGITLAIEPSGSVARVSMVTEPAGSVTIDGVEVPVVKSSYGDLVDLPDPQDGVKYIVSGIVLSAAKAAGRSDCLGPNTGSAVRDENGRIVAVKSLTA